MDAQPGMYLYGAIVLAIVVFIVARTFVLWYFGISQTHRNQGKIIALLNELNGRPVESDEPKSPTVARAEPAPPKPSPYDLQKS